MLRSMTSEDLQKNILSTYFTLRAGIVLVSAALPVILYVYSRAADGGLVEHSMSAFYGADGARMRNWFVGILWAVGAFLALYKGFSVAEDWALNSAGAFAVLTAMTPCNCWTGAGVSQSKLHAFFAVMFFASMAFVCLFCAHDTISLLPNEPTKNRFKRTYRVVGILLAASPLAALVVSYLLQSYISRTFFIEWFGVWVFAAYWLVKSREFHITAAEKRALRGELRKAPGVGLVPLEPAPPSPDVH